MANDAATVLPRRSRFWLFAPLAVLALLILGWSAAWFVVRGRAEQMLDAVLAREAAAGRHWQCANRTVAGFPFRIEVACDALTLKRGELQASLGRIVSLVQVYAPRHVITEIEAPLRVTDGARTLEGTWRLLQSSVRATAGGLERASLVIEEPSFRLAGLAPAELTAAGRYAEAHVRPNARRDQAEKAVDIVARAAEARLPVLDELVGGSEPADIEAQVTVTQVDRPGGRPLAEVVEGWRQAGGTLDLVLLALTKGTAAVEATGTLRLDAMHRLEGRVEAAASGLDGVLGQLQGRAGPAGAILGALAGRAPGQPRDRARAREAKPALTPLPPLRLEGGRLFFGPFPVPGVRLVPLY